MKSQVKDLLKVAGAAALTLVLAVFAFVGVNHVALAAATQPEPLPLSAAQTSFAANTPALQDTKTYPEYEEPVLNVILDESLDKNGKPYSVPGANTMTPEEAAQIGAQYIFDMTGEVIDGKTVSMAYMAPQFSNKAYWEGRVANSANDMNMADYAFSIDAVTGESVSINLLKLNAELNRAKYGDGDIVTIFKSSSDEAPENADEYAAAARTFAEKHFSHSTVAGVDFSTVKSGDVICFDVTDSTGRVASVDVDMGTKQVTYLNTSDSDIVPGYDYKNADYAG
jgi:cytochrome c5